MVSQGNTVSMCLHIPNPCQVDMSLETETLDQLNPL